MAPVLVTGNNTCGIVLIVQVPGAVCINEHAIGIVHEILMAIELALRIGGIQVLGEITGIPAASILVSADIDKDTTFLSLRRLLLENADLG
jgi:hypothetical protein